MAGLAEAKNAEITKLHLFIVSLHVFDDCHRDSSLITRRVRSIGQVNLAEASRCDGHHVLV